MLKKEITVLLILALSIAIFIVTPVAANPQVETYIVETNTDFADADLTDGVCATAGGKCSLTAAIEQANVDGVYSTIKFASRFVDTNKISSCNLPALTEDNTTIDASDQWDNAYDRPGVNITASSCTLLTIQSSGNSVMGIQFGGGDSIGVLISGGSQNSIGGYNTGQRNVFLTGKYGVHVHGGTYNYVINNFVGTLTGESMPGGGFSEIGIYIQSNDMNVVSSNLVVGQNTSGIRIWGSGNVVTENIVGLDYWKKIPLPNTIGIELVWADNNVIGPYNVVAGNTDKGIYVYHADDNLIDSNQIGYPWHAPPIGNGGDGIHIHASLNTKITDNGANSNSGNGIYVNGSGGLLITGNGITSNNLDGINMKSSDGTIGGSSSNLINTLSGNGGNGIRLDASNTITITGNYIGLDHIGAFEQGNQGHGILVENGTTNTVIGGLGIGEGNWIGWNHGSGVHLTGSTTQNNYVVGNVFGAPINWGWEAPNHNHGIGVYDGAHGNRIGGIDPGAGNTVLASGWSGVVIVSSDFNSVIANRIGTDGANINWGNNNYGIDVVDGSNNALSFNEIAYNGMIGGEDGVHIEGPGAIGNTISQNSIHDNGGTGIVLENGGNNNLASPVITQASCQGPVIGTTTCVNCLVEIFSDDVDEGRIYEGYFTTDPTGGFSWNGNPSGPYVTATVRDQNNNTSPFSFAFDVGSTCNTSPQAAFTVNPQTGDTNTKFSFDASKSSDKEDPVSALEVRWDWENDGVYNTNWSTTKKTTHTFTDSIVYYVRLQVRDTAGLTGSTTQQVTVTGSGGGGGSSYQAFLPLVRRGVP
jgi:parallel beta-helix repeat protein